MLKSASPVLCRSVCDNVPSMDGNALTQVTFSDGRKACVCEIGIERLVTYTPAVQISSTHFDGTRRKLQDDSVQSHSEKFKLPKNVTDPKVLFPQKTKNLKVPFTGCDQDRDCGLYHNTTICKNAWGYPTPCYSCQDRGIIEGEGFICNAQEKICECQVHKKNADHTTQVVDGTLWKGNSFCDRVMQGYHLQQALSPLEKASIQRCILLRNVAIKVSNTLLLPTLPLDLFYNPTRWYFFTSTTLNGVFLYFTEGWNNKPTSVFFDYLISKKIDPIVVFKILETLQRITQQISTMGKKLNVSQTLGEINPAYARLSEKFFLNVQKMDYHKDNNDLYALSSFAAEVMLKSVRNSTTFTKRSQVETRSDEFSLTYFQNKTSGRGDRAPLATLADALNATVGRALRVASDPGACVFSDVVRRTLDDGATQLVRHYATNGTFDRSLCLFRNFEDRNYRVTGFGLLGAEFDVDAGGDRACRAGQPVKKRPKVNLPRGDPLPVSLPKDLGAFLGPGPKREVERALGEVTTLFAASEYAREAQELLKNSVTCDWETLACEAPKRFTVEEGLLLTQGLALGGATLASFLGAPVALVAVFAMFGQLVSFPLFLWLVYGLSPLCAPALPTCLADDLFHSLDRALPAFIPWPRDLVPDREARSSFGFLKLVRTRRGDRAPLARICIFPVSPRKSNERRPPLSTRPPNPPRPPRPGTLRPETAGTSGTSPRGTRWRGCWCTSAPPCRAARSTSCPACRPRCGGAGRARARTRGGARRSRPGRSRSRSRRPRFCCCRPCCCRRCSSPARSSSTRAACSGRWPDFATSFSRDFRNRRRRRLRGGAGFCSRGVPAGTRNRSSAC